MVGNLGMMEGSFVIILSLLVWLVPIVLAVWLIRTVAAMATAQREIVRRLASIDEHLQRASGTPRP
jgi:hypothetical protein